MSKSKNSQIVNGKIDSKLNSDSFPSSPSSYKSSSSTNAKIWKNNREDENEFELYYEDNKHVLENDYPDMPKDDIKKYLRKTWENMDIEYRKKLKLHMTSDSLLSHLKESSLDEDKISTEIDINIKENKKTKDRKEERKKESSPDEDEMLIEIDTTIKENKRTKSRVYREEIKKESSPDEDEISIEIDTTIKENKKTKNKVDRDENSVSEMKRSRMRNLFKGMKQEKVCQICEETGKLTRCRGPCYSYFHLSCVKPGESSPEYPIDENTLDDRLLSDLNIIKRSINGENNGKYNNNSKYINIYLYVHIRLILKNSFVFYYNLS